LSQPIDVIDQLKNKGKRLIFNILIATHTPFRSVLTENNCACTDWKLQRGFRGQRFFGAGSTFNCLQAGFGVFALLISLW